ncbi:hypothetical protein AhnVgp117 [Adoxophyes honmai nucleopolyhedrovirus]|uniref:Per os infectivity factor 1 n=1 Tax=Adoxophyes honmai nucleopolyhedrovirus TaxID=224399 RepID=Q80LH9_NPVAH|nr:hypothetical protein AhnVgp117 [Adoxophyes honmai nucleopolyhedrovirus]BAC67368.1 hypothetical protein [Adoxophyes honmai nucleopolyhedrovirus]
MLLIVIVCFLIIIIILLCHFVFLLNLNNEIAIHAPLARFDNSHIPLIEPPNEIVIEGNTHECHRKLTPCMTHSDCDLCREGLANCQLFTEQTILTMHDDMGKPFEHIIEPGESYCLALDRNRARSCNPNTGIWILTESAGGFSLLCSCLKPGLVTQLNMYEDCNITVGCQPNGQILDINENPMRCLCDEGYVSDFSAETQTPICRPLTIRDIIYDPAFFPRHPCPAGFVRLDHPALDDRYRQELRLPDICVIDPCSIDPISGLRVSGQLMYYKDDTVEYKYCSCVLEQNAFAVFSPGPSMLGQSTANVSNACIRPFNTSLSVLERVDYKFFWGQGDTTRSDDDIVAMVRANQLSHNRYEAALYQYLTAHPNATNTNFMILKFSTAYSPRNVHLINQNVLDVTNQTVFDRYLQTSKRTQAPCFFPGDGRCIVSNHDDCIRRHGNAQVWTAESFTGMRCFLSREGQFLKIWNSANNYSNNRYPVALRVNVLFGLQPNNRHFNTVLILHGNQVNVVSHSNLANTLNTYPNYSVN